MKKRFINEEDLTVESFEEFSRDIEMIMHKHNKERERLTESVTPQFNSVEEANSYYNAMPFNEWENKIFEEYGINGIPT